MIQAIHVGEVLAPDHLGPEFPLEERRFMIDIANLEYKWRLGKKEKDEDGSINLTSVSCIAKQPPLSLITVAPSKVLSCLI